MACYVGKRKGRERRLEVIANTLEREVHSMTIEDISMYLWSTLQLMRLLRTKRHSVH